MSMNLTFKALAALLEYPDAALVEAMPEVEAVLAEESVLEGADRDALAALVRFLRDSDLMDAQEAYVELFDRGRAVSLNLFEHVHGEARDRGQAMVDLKGLYEKNGLELSANQLPDYLPVFLEYLATRPLDEARESLGDVAHILAAIGAGLGRRASPWQAVFRALLRLAGEQSPEKRIAGIAVEDDSSADALDRVWEADPVTFLGSCAPQQPRDPQVIHFHKRAAS
jgi:nitrate reductase delta subunit